MYDKQPYQLSTHRKYDEFIRQVKPVNHCLCRQPCLSAPADFDVNNPRLFSHMDTAYSYHPTYSSNVCNIE